MTKDTTHRLEIQIERGWLEHAAMRTALRTILNRCRWVREAHADSVAGTMVSVTDFAGTIEADVLAVLQFVDSVE